MSPEYRTVTANDIARIRAQAEALRADLLRRTAIAVWARLSRHPRRVEAPARTT